MNEDERGLDLNTLDFNPMVLEEDQFVSDAILIIRSSLPNGISRCSVLVTNHMDFIVAQGMAMTLMRKVTQDDGGLFQQVGDE
jgi:hypothetical protein